MIGVVETGIVVVVFDIDVGVICTSGSVVVTGVGDD
jgi:hypothetical protein